MCHLDKDKSDLVRHFARIGILRPANHFPLVQSLQAITGDGLNACIRDQFNNRIEVQFPVHATGGRIEFRRACEQPKRLHNGFIFSKHG